MFNRKATAVLTMVGLVASTTTCFAQGPAIGCNNLPEHDRAVGTIENGPYSCGMSTKEAQRILARDQAATQPVNPAPRKHHRRKSRHTE